jgi:hypothetical protein
LADDAVQRLVIIPHRHQTVARIVTAGDAASVTPTVS